NFGRLQRSPEILKRRIRVLRIPFPVHSVADGTMHGIGALAEIRLLLRRNFDHRENPGHFIAVDIEDPGVRIYGGSSPFPASVTPREYQRTFRTGRTALPSLSDSPKSLERPLRGLGSDSSDIVFFKFPAGEGRWFRRKWLSRPRFLSR